MLTVCLAMIDNDDDRKSFERLVEKYQNKLYHEAYKVLNSHDLSENAVWETFYKIAENFQFVYNLPVHKMEAYLIITIKRESYKISNKEKLYLNRGTMSEAEKRLNFDWFEHMDNTIILQAVTELDEKYKAVLAYVYYYGHSAVETAKIMGISKRTVYKYLNKAHKKLSERLNDGYDK